MLFQVAATIKKIETMSDRGIKLRVDTQELTPEQSQVLFGLLDKYGYFLFKENDFETEDIPTTDAPEFNTDKSPSKRLRDCLWVYWRENTKQTKPFEQFWREWVDKKCAEIKNLLP